MTESPPPLRWKFSQVFGDITPAEDDQEDEKDIITAIGFEKRGDYLAVGDQSGRMVIFKRDDRNNADLNQQHSRQVLEQQDFAPSPQPRFHYNTEFQAYEHEFDCLLSVEVDEKINKVRWCITQNGPRFILSANDKTIKLWKIKEHKMEKVEESVSLPSESSENAVLDESNEQESQSSGDGRHLELMSPSQDINAEIADIDEIIVQAKCQKEYDRAHSYHINSISNNSDCETFISADDLRINLWNFEVTDQCFNIIDIKPANMSTLIEVITAAEFHPIQCNLLAYSSSRGLIRLCDLRQAALCDHGARIFQHQVADGHSAFFAEMISCISDIKFLEDGQRLISRDYMYLKLWDIRMDSSPVSVFKVHEHLRPRLAETLFDNEPIFDKFDCCFSGDGLHIATGSYSNLLRTFCVATGREEGTRPENIETSDRNEDAPKFGRAYNLTSQHDSSGANSGSIDFSSKLSHVAWHPTSNLVACATRSTLILYYD